FNPANLTSSWFSYLMEGAFQSLTGGADAKRGGRDAIRAAKEQQRGIAADPPNPDFQRPDVAVAGAPTAVLPADRFGADAGRLVDELRIDTALSGAFLDALERYQGAQQLGSGPWGLIHLRAAARLATQLEARLELTADAWE